MLVTVGWMPRSSGLLAATMLALLVPAALHAQNVREVRVSGAKELEAGDVRRASGAMAGEPLADSLERIAERVQNRYREDGFMFANARISFEPDAGVLTVDVDEGVIEGVEFQGVDEGLARRFADEFALRAGDVFNRRRALHALDVMLQQTRGAVDRRRQGTFDLVDRNGRRVLLVGLREPPGRFKLVPDLGEREDWFSSVDGFVPSLGFGAAVFDHERFNHA